MNEPVAWDPGALVEEMIRVSLKLPESPLVVRRVRMDDGTRINIAVCAGPDAELLLNTIKKSLVTDPRSPTP